MAWKDKAVHLVVKSSPGGIGRIGCLHELDLHSDFMLAGSAMANVRTSFRRAEREGVVLFWFEGVPPEETMKQLQQTSRHWLDRKAGKYSTEMWFSMGRFDGLVEACLYAEEVVSAAVAQRDESVARVPRLVTGMASRSTGQVCAFVTFTTMYGTYSSVPKD